MAFRNALASLAVRDLDSAVEWYAKVIGKPPDSRPMPGIAEWKFDGGGWLQLYQLPERAGGGSVTLAVSALDDHAAALQTLGVDTRQRTANARVATLMFTDRDGNHIALAEARDPTMAQ